MKNYQLIVKKTNCDGIGNVLKGYISALSICPTSKIENNPEYIFGAYDTILDKKHIYYDDNDSNIEKIYTCRLLILKEEEQLQDNIVNEFQDYDGIGNTKFNSLFCPKLIDWNYNPALIHPIISKRIFNIIDTLKFAPQILYIVNYIKTLLANKILLGISVRTWKSKHESNINRQYSLDIYKSKIKNVLDLHPSINYILLSIDNHDFINEYLDIFKEKNISCLILNKSEKINDLQFAIIKVLLLSKCNYFIGNRISTFSELVFWFSKHQTQVYTVF